MMPGIRRGLLLILLLASLMLILPGCGGYSQYTQLEGDAHFSFEYPRCYREAAKTDLGVESKATRVFLLREGRLEGLGNFKHYDVSWIKVFIHKAGEYGEIDASTAMEHAILKVSTANYTDIEVLGTTSVEIAGVSAQCLEYSYHDYYPSFRSATIFRVVYFDYGGFVWNIEVVYVEEYAQETEAYFGHLLQTFQILD